MSNSAFPPTSRIAIIWPIPRSICSRAFGAGLGAPEDCRAAHATAESYLPFLPFPGLFLLSFLLGSDPPAWWLVAVCCCCQS